MITFRNGPCSPVTIVPGILATRLDAQFDCEIVKNTPVWNACKLSNICTEGAKTKRIEAWFTLTQSPSSVLHGQEQNCFGEIVKLQIDNLKGMTDEQLKGEIQFQNVPGVTVSWNSGNVMKQRRCGFDRINQMVGEDAIVDLSKLSVAAAGMWYMEDNLKKIGYTTGLNLFAQPYDFRHRPGANRVLFRLWRTIRWASFISHKKVVVVTHSFGSLNTLHALHKFEAKRRSKHVRRFVPIAPPFSGSMTPSLSSIGYFNPLEFPSNMGYNMQDVNIMLATSPGIWSLFLKQDTFQNDGAPWKTLISQRASAERIGQDTTVDIGSDVFDFFPKSDVDCTTRDLAGADDNKCGFKMRDYYSQPFVKTPTDEFHVTQEDYLRLLNAKGLVPNGPSGYTLTPEKIEEYKREIMPKFLKHVQYSNVGQLPNPQVPVTLIYGAHTRTEQYLEIVNEADDNLKISQFQIPDFDKMNAHWGKNAQNTMSNPKQVRRPGQSMMEYGFGDASVNSDTSLTAGLKWAYDYHTQQKDTLSQEKQYHPVQIVEYCSQYNSLVSSLIDQQPKTKSEGFWSKVYQATDTIQKTIGANVMNAEEISWQPQTQNEYRGLPCTRQAHSGMPADPYIVFLVQNIVSKESEISFDQTNLEQGKSVLDDLTDEQIDQVIKTCPNLYADELNEDSKIGQIRDHFLNYAANTYQEIKLIEDQKSADDKLQQEQYKAHSVVGFQRLNKRSKKAKKMVKVEKKARQQSEKKLRKAKY